MQAAHAWIKEGDLLDCFEFPSAATQLASSQRILTARHSLTDSPKGRREGSKVGGADR